MIQDNTRIYAVGDIHGRVDLLREIQALILDDAKTASAHGAALGGRKILVYLGDYIDRGPSSMEVLDHLISTDKTNEELGFESVYLKGNHEDYFLRFMASGELGKAWMNNGGAALLNNFGLELSANSSPEEFVETASLLRRMLSPDHRCFLMGLQTYFEYHEYYFVHAGIRPGVSLQNQRIQDMLWIRDDFMNSNIDFGKIIVHGHTIGDAPEIMANRISIDTGAYLSNRLTCVVIENEHVRFLQT